MKVNLGVIDIPYDYGVAPATTHQVAEDLEEQYKLFTNFYYEHQEEILREIHETINLQLVNHINYGVPFDESVIILSEVVKAFSLFIEREEMAGLDVNGVPTLAALEGINSRLKIHHGPRRPSFIDGGLFLSSFNAWISFDA
jgi:hypothetical protein